MNITNFCDVGSLYKDDGDDEDDDNDDDDYYYVLTQVHKW